MPWAEMMQTIIQYDDMLSMTHKALRQSEEG